MALLKSGRLFPFLKGGSYAKGSLADEFYAVAYSIEEVLVLAGAEAGKDYTHMDVMKLAEPMVRELFRSGKITEYERPADHTV